MYISLLLKIFAYAASTINKANKQDHPDDSQEEDVSVNSSPADNCDDSLIEREIHLKEDGMHIRRGQVSVYGGPFHLAYPSYFVKSGIEAIIEDDVTKRFSSADLEVWNLLSRNQSYQHINKELTILWVIGFIIRYILLLPVRLVIASVSLLSLIGVSALIALFPVNSTTRTLNRGLIVFCFRLFVRAYSGVIRFHNPENRPKMDGICVANHTTPIDVIILGCDNVYAMVGQKQGGLFGILQSAFGRATSTIWFERSETRDRMEVTRRMKAHVEDPNTCPILIFPEGTCINNTSVMQFKKGSFEVGATIYPVAIKYDPRFCDCFWNSSKYSLSRYLLMMMTSWAIVADVWYLPPEQQRPDEDAIQFANRVKRMIAEKGGLVDLQWDGQLKRSKPKDTLKHVQQESFSRFMKTE